MMLYHCNWMQLRYSAAKRQVPIFSCDTGSAVKEYLCNSEEDLMQNLMLSA